MSTTREQILDAAGRLIHLRGFHNTSVDDILRESGVGKGNLYYYFKSKDELGYAALDRTLERIQEEILERLSASGVDPWTQLERFLEYAVERARREGCVGGCPLGNRFGEATFWRASNTSERRLSQVRSRSKRR
jgi:TetR/AcrR family transcriptional repressor of nem operon